MGDPSDNIPGVAGIGEKTAAKLIKKFDSLDKLYQTIEGLDFKKSPRADLGIRPRVLEMLREQKEQAYLSKKLAAIVTDLDVKVDLEACRIKNYDIQKVIKLFQELEFKSLIPRLPKADLMSLRGVRDAAIPKQ